MRDVIAGLALGFWQLPEDIPAWQWCEKHIRLLSCPTPRPGPYSTALTPYVRSVLNAIADPAVREIVLCFGSQTGKTTTLMVGASWLIANTPGPFIWAFPNDRLARMFSAERWIKMMEDSPTMRELLPSDRRRWTHLSQSFRNALFIFTGSNSPANLASHPARFVILDEVDKLALATTREANATELAKQRAKAYWTIRKILETSTPTSEDGQIWQDFLQGDQTRSFWHCTNCGKEILPVFSKEMSVLPKHGVESELVWDNVEYGSDNWEQRTRDSTRLQCCHCGHQMTESHKTRLLREAVERPTIRNSEIRSFHLSSLYAPDITWGDLVVKFRKAKHSIDGLQGFVNGELAEPWMQQDEIKERREAIVLSGDPAASERACRVLTADYQEREDHWWVCRDWFYGGHSRLVEWGRWTSDAELEETRIRMNVAPDLTGVDSGHEGTAIYRMCALFGWFACRGDGAESWPHHVKGKHTKPVHRIWTERKFDPYSGTAHAGRKTVNELRWSNPGVKAVLKALRNKDRSPVRWEIPEQYATDEYFRHLDGEYEVDVYNPKTGKTQRIWKKRGRRWPDHLRDCELEQIAVAIRLGVLKTNDD